jgi:hypothetical protein
MQSGIKGVKKWSALWSFQTGNFFCKNTFGYWTNQVELTDESEIAEINLAGKVMVFF